MFKLISLLRDKIRQDGVDLYALPFPGFVMDTRSSPIEIRFELDIRNDRNLAAWRERWHTKAFNEGWYGSRLVEETVSARRPAAATPPKAVAAVEARPATAAKVLRLNGPLAA